MYQLLVRRLCATWSAHPELICPYVPKLFVSFLLYKEGVPDDHNLANWEDGGSSCGFGLGREGGGEGVDVPLRFMVLGLIETLCFGPGPDPVSDSVRQVFEQLIFSLLKLNISTEFSAPPMLGSEKFGRKLRLWQVRRRHGQGYIERYKSEQARLIHKLGLAVNFYAGK